MTKNDDIVDGLPGSKGRSWRTAATAALAIAAIAGTAAIVVVAVGRILPPPATATDRNGEVTFDGKRPGGNSYAVNRKACVDMLEQPGLSVRIDDDPNPVATGLTAAQAETRCGTRDRIRIELIP